MGRLLPILLATGSLLLGVAPQTRAEQPEPVALRILAITDLHGHVDSEFMVEGQSVGGIRFLAAHLRALAAQVENSTIVSAGDLIGASPLISAISHDELTIRAANLLALDFSALGNHEFDEGPAELLRMQKGGCHPTAGCFVEEGFGGARFQFLAANVVRRKTHETFVPAVGMKEFRGVRVAFVGMAPRSTPAYAVPERFAGLEFLDEVETLNKVVAGLRRDGVEAIVALVHEGTRRPAGGGINDCQGIAGPVVDIVERTDPAVDLFITGHTHWPFNCKLDGRPVVGAGAYGQIFTQIDAELDPLTGDMNVLTVENRLNTRDVEPAPDVTALIEDFKRRSAPLAGAIVGRVGSDVVHAADAAGQSPLGNLIADAQLAATSAPGSGDADVAFTTFGAIRADLAYPASETEEDGEVTFAEAFAVQPFGNSLVTMTLTGSDLRDLLEKQFDNPVPGRSKILQVSEGFQYEWSDSAPSGSKVDAAKIQLRGAAIDPEKRYRVTVNDYLAGGGAGFGAVLSRGTDRLGGVTDVEALVAFLKTHSPVAASAGERIRKVP